MIGNLVWTLFVLAAVPLIAFAKVTGPYYAAGERVQILDYAADTDTYEIRWVKYPGQGPFYARLNDVAKAVSSLKAADLRARPESIFEEEVDLTADLPLLADSDLEDLRAAQAKASRKSR